MECKTCLKVSSPFSVPASQHNGVGFLLSPLLSIGEPSFRARALTYTPSLPLWGSHGVSSSGAAGGQPAC